VTELEPLAAHHAATNGVRQTLKIARDGYGLSRLMASAALDNPGSLAVLRRTGFIPVGELLLPGRPGLRHPRDLTTDVEPV
jgi:ribosomal-protein-alanine N-acetyltransferase